MGVIVNKENDRDTELNRRIDMELKQKMQSTSYGDANPDFAEESEYTKDLKKTSKFGWIWIVLIVLALVSLIFILI